MDEVTDHISLCIMFAAVGEQLVRAKKMFLEEVHRHGRCVLLACEPYPKIPELYEMNLALYPRGMAEEVYEHLLQIIGSGWIHTDLGGRSRDAVASAGHGATFSFPTIEWANIGLHSPGDQ
jgi:hypothetical protein